LKKFENVNVVVAAGFENFFYVAETKIVKNGKKREIAIVARHRKRCEVFVEIVDGMFKKETKSGKLFGFAGIV